AALLSKMMKALAVVSDGSKPLKNNMHERYARFRAGARVRQGECSSQPQLKVSGPKGMDGLRIRHWVCSHCGEIRSSMPAKLEFRTSTRVTFSPIGKGTLPKSAKKSFGLLSEPDKINQQKVVRPVSCAGQNYGSLLPMMKSGDF